MAKYIKSFKHDYNILLLSDIDDNKSKVYSSIFSDIYNDTSYLIMDSLNKIDSILPILLKRGDDWGHLLDKLSKKKSNLIVITSNQVPFLTYAFNQIIEFSNTQNHYRSNFEIFGFEDLYRMKTIDVLYKNKFNLHFVSKGIPNLNSQQAEDFNKIYKDVFSAEPTKFSYLGYDILRGLINDVNYNRIDLGSGSENNLVKFYNIKNYNLNQISKD